MTVINSWKQYSDSENPSLSHLAIVWQHHAAEEAIDNILRQELHDKFKDFIRTDPKTQTMIADAVKAAVSGLTLEVLVAEIKNAIRDEMAQEKK